MKRLMALVLALVLLPWQAAVAAPAHSPTITITPQTVGPGGNLTITATGLTANASCSLSIGTSPTALNISGTMTNSSGGYSYTAQLPGNTQPGSYQVYLTCAGTPLNSTLIVSNPQIVLNPNPVAPGGTVNISGSGFAANSSITISTTWNLAGGTTQVLNQNVAINQNGTFANVIITVPATTVNSTYTLLVSQSGQTITQKSLTVGQGTSLSLSPSSVSSTSYTTVTVSGTGFLPSERVDFSYLANLNGTTQQASASATADANGNFTNGLLPVYQGITAGPYTVTATGESSHRTATSTLTVTAPPTIVLSPASVSAGSTVTVTGQNFNPGSPVSVTVTVPLTNGTSQDVTATGTADAAGHISIQVPIPAGANNGTIHITASQTVNSTTVTAGANLTVSHLSPVIQLTPSTVYVGPTGAAVAVSGTGFLAATPVVVSTSVIANGAPLTVTETVNADANGAFFTAIPLPAGTVAGTSTVTATQQAAGASTSASLTLQTQTLGPTATPSPTPSPTTAPPPPPTPTPTPLAFASIVTQKHTVRPHQLQRVDAQATLKMPLVIWVHINFPTGLHYDYKMKTDANGHFSITFRVPAHATNRYTRRVYVHLQLWLNGKTAKTFGSFLIK